jgi:hypothetical protein
VATRFKFSVALPIAQVAVTGILTFWADRTEWVFFGERGPVSVRDLQVARLVVPLRQIWRGVNGPALPFTFNGYATDYPALFGFGLSELFYLATVAVVWWLAGRYIDRCRGLLNHRRKGGLARALNIACIAWGLLLLWLSLLWIHDFYWGRFSVSVIFMLQNRLYLGVAQFLFLIWSSVLIALNGIALTRGIRRKKV